MGERIKVKDLMEWLSRFKPENDIAFFIEGKGKNGNDDAYDLFEVWERPIGKPYPAENTTIFLNLK